LAAVSSKTCATPLGPKSEPSTTIWPPPLMEAPMLVTAEMVGVA
jgi:hypothetical protein